MLRGGNSKDLYIPDTTQNCDAKRQNICLWKEKSFSACRSIVWHQLKLAEPSFDWSGNNIPMWKFAASKTDLDLFFMMAHFSLGV